MAEASASLPLIEVLDPLVADQIAAGEVIERPASVVKELVENALDAGAREVAVELTSGGRERILVRDDGHGMTAACAQRACLRHATSKLRRIEDLDGIASLGFRGEALASIAAVADVVITTRARGADEGVRVELSQGRVTSLAPAGAPVGTTVEVRDLFAAMPARRKFLRSVQTEVGHVNELLARLALARPEVGFQCLHDRRELLHHPRVTRPDERLRQVLGAARVRAMCEIDRLELGIRVRGWISKAGESFPQARSVQTYVGGRFVRDRVVLKAILDAYRGLLPAGRYPAAVLHVDVPVGAVDVNVHPTKTEVRFAHADSVYGAVTRAVRAGLAAAVESPVALSAVAGASAAAAITATPGTPSAAGLPRAEAASGIREALAAYARREPSPPRGSARTPFPTRVPTATPAPERLPGLGESAAPRPRFAALRVLGQALGGYIVCEAADALVLVDQHAAHERVRFERLRAESRDAGGFPSQRLLVARIAEVGAGVRDRLDEIAAELRGAGFELELFGASAVAVRALPASLDVTTDVEVLLADLARDLERLGASERLAAARDALLARIACHGAVRAGDPLTLEEMRGVVADLDGIPFAATCPHGRPLLFEVTRSEIARRVGRT
jgi:DNA mismatch repair protein MutL